MPEYFANIPIKVMKMLFRNVLWMKDSIWSFCKHYGNVTFECSLKKYKTSNI